MIPGSRFGFVPGYGSTDTIVRGFEVELSIEPIPTSPPPPSAAPANTTVIRCQGKAVAAWASGAQDAVGYYAPKTLSVALASKGWTASSGIDPYKTTGWIDNTYRLNPFTLEANKSLIYELASYNAMHICVLHVKT